MAQALYQGQSEKRVLVFGLVFIVAGVAFRLGLVPFHMWIPDVYHGAPTAVTMFIGSAPKFAAFAALDRDNMPRSIWSLAGQIADKKASSRIDKWDLACRVWRAFDPSNWDVARIQLKGTDVPLAEMAKVAQHYQMSVTKAARGGR